MFYDYYGDFDYADKWVSAALAGVSMDFSSGVHGPNDFSALGDAARIEAVKKGAAYMNVWMYAACNPRSPHTTHTYTISLARSLFCNGAAPPLSAKTCPRKSYEHLNFKACPISCPYKPGTQFASSRTPLTTA